MNDVQRYRDECLSAAERCEPAYRCVTLAVAASWLSLARQQETMDELLVIWSKASSVALAASSRRSFQYPPDLQLPLFATPARGRDTASTSASWCS
jgi:hypothetical protein